MCVVSGDKDGCLSSRVTVPPHGVCDAHGGTEEGGEAQEGDEDGGHLADSVCPAGGLTVHHHTALWEGKTQTQMIREVRGHLEKLRAECVRSMDATNDCVSNL